MAFVKVPPHARAAAAARGHRFAAYPRCSADLAGGCEGAVRPTRLEWLGENRYAMLQVTQEV